MSAIPRYAAPSPPFPRHNLGLYRLRGFCGRHRELHRLQSWLADSERGAVSAVIGPAGVGKSALATAAAWTTVRHFADGIVWAAPAGWERLRFYDVIRALDSVLGSAITGRPRAMWQTEVLQLLHRRRRLVILDEAETADALDWEALVATFQRLPAVQAPSRILIVASRIPPAVQALAGERILRLQGFTLRDTATFLSRHPSLPLSPDAARQRTAGSPLGLHLLLGLAAPARAAAPPVAHVEALEPLTAYALHACAREQAEGFDLLLRLAAAAGGASYRALQELFGRGQPVARRAGSDRGVRNEPELTALPAPLPALLQALLTRALVEHDPWHRRVRVHACVRRQLARGAPAPRADWQAAHARYYVRYARLYEQVDRAFWSDLDREWDNMRQGAEWCARRIRRACPEEPLTLTAAIAEGRAPPALPLPAADLALASQYASAMALYAFWRHPPRSLEWLAAGAVACASLADFRGFGRLMLHLGRQLYFRRDYERSLFWLEKARAAFAQRDMVLLLAYAHTDIGMVHRERGQPGRARSHCQQAFDCLVQGGNLAELAGAYMNLGSLALSLGDYPQALRHYRHGLRLALALDDRRLMANAFNNLGLALEALSHLWSARAMYEKALDLYRYLRLEEGECTALNNLGAAAHLQADAPAAEAWYRQAQAVCAQRGAWLDLAATRHNLGMVLQQRHRAAEANREFAASRALYDALDLPAYAAAEDALIRRPARGGAAASIL